MHAKEAEMQMKRGDSNSEIKIETLSDGRVGNNKSIHLENLSEDSFENTLKNKINVVNKVHQRTMSK